MRRYREEEWERKGRNEGKDGGGGAGI